MVNRIKNSGADGLALQVTKQARSAGLVIERGEDRVDRAEVRVFSFRELLLVVDQDLPDHHVATLVASATRDTESIYRSLDATLSRAGNGFQVQLPPAEDAGFEVGDRGPVLTAPGILVIHTKESVRLANDLVAMRREQTGAQ